MSGFAGLELAPIAPIDGVVYEQARARHAQLTKPPGSLGRLEDLGCRLAAIQGHVPPRVDRMRALVFAADHGITAAERVSPYPREVTAQMVANFVGGGAAVNALCATVGAELRVFDVGVATPIPVPEDAPGLVRRPVAAGTRNIVEAPAMTADELVAAMRVGAAAVDEAAADEVDVVALGEMGIGNTTIAAAVTAALLGLPAAEVVGPGTGADPTMVGRKAALVEAALVRHTVDRTAPLELLRRLGGFELAAIAGATLRAAARRIAVVADGFITTAAVAVAVAEAPAARDYVFAGHGSAEPGHRHLLARLDLLPCLDLQMRLGEASGAVLALPLLRAAAAVLRDMATFADAGVSGRA